MNILLAIWLLVAAILARVMPKSSFITPPPSGLEGDYKDNPTYQEGQEINIEWQTGHQFAYLRLFQEYPSDGGEAEHRSRTLYLSTTERNYTWTVSLKRDGLKGPESIANYVAKGEDAIFYVSLHNGSESPAQFATSHYFNVTVGRPIPPPGSNYTSTSTAMNTMTASATSAPTASASGNGPGLSTGASAGIAAGASVGGVLALGALGSLAWRHLRKRKGSEKQPAVSEPEMTKHVPELATFLHQPIEKDTETTKDAPQPIYEAP